jgi:hypothetical protein
MSAPQTDGWDWFDAPCPPDALPEEDIGRELAIAFARCFNSGPGARVLAHLRNMTQHRFYGPDAPDAALRHLEGQRHFVAYISAMIERGEAA